MFEYLYDKDCDRFVGEDGPETQRVLRATAPRFFDDLHKWLRDLYFLYCARLLDPARQGSNRNLTVEFFVMELKKLDIDDQTSADLNNLKSRLDAYRDVIVDPRRKLIAHRDLPHSRSALTIGVHTLEAYEQFFIDLNRFTDRAGTALGKDPLNFAFLPGEGDVHSLIHILRVSAGFDKMPEN